MIKELCFSNGLIKATIYINEPVIYVKNESIVINLDEKYIYINNICVPKLKSSIFSNVDIFDSTIVLIIECDFFTKNKIDFSFYKKNWELAFDIFKVESLKTTPLWRSEKDSIGGFSFNLWFADSRIDCGIHNEHNFIEVHTQIYGLGRMQRFLNKDKESKYNEVIMCPGYTHTPFYTSTNNIPFHQYFSDTECIWLAIEYGS